MACAHMGPNNSIPLKVIAGLSLKFPHVALIASFAPPWEIEIACISYNQAIGSGTIYALPILFLLCSFPEVSSW